MNALPPLPFTDADVCASFPDLTISTPHLGQGSFKVAYSAESGAGDLVLKIIYSFPITDDPDEFDFDQVPDRIARELSSMSAVNSPHIVSLVSDPAVTRIGTASFLCYEEPFYSGGTLEDRLRSGALDRIETKDLLVALLRASSALWAADKIVHRDIKPGNVAYADDGTPVLLDLGLVLFTEMSALTDSGFMSPMTPRYAAPEQFEQRRNAQIDFRTDQYLIGLTVLEAARGRHPFFRPGISTAEYMQALRDFSASNLAQDDLDDDVREVLGRLLSYAMYGRYRTPEIPLEKLGV
ncbi:protein kinase domain-containing protein [Microbacterium sp. PA5]|uniref:protein kinase domain-containing protein n=1 Tax=Microbacterium sp. PA5 TaxID=3416654 RepID=UPI003CED1EA4